MNRSTPSLRHKAAWAVCTIGCILAPAFMNAQLDRTRPPAPGPAPEVSLGGHTTLELPNGMHLIVVEDHKLPLVSVQLRFDVPPIAQREKMGYVDMMGELITAGTTTRTKAQIDLAIDALGADLSAGNDGVYAGALKSKLEPLMDLMQDVVKNPTFPSDEVDKARVRYRSSVQQRHEDPEAIAEMVGRSVTFGRTHPYGEVMTEKTLAMIDRESMAAYHRYYFRPEKAYLVFVGDITEKEARDLAKEHFGKWKPAPAITSTDEKGNTVVEGIGVITPLTRPMTPGGVRRVFLVDRPDAAQSVIRVSFPLNLIPKDIRAQQSQVMNTILGGGIFNARLMQNLREKRGFTYGAYSSLDVDRYNSSFIASVSVRTEVTDSAVIEILAELERMRNEPVTDEELKLAKSSMAGSFGRGLENPRTVARFALNTALNDLSADHYKTYLTRLESITAQHVQDAAVAFLHPDQAIILVVGDKDRVAHLLAPFSQESTNPVIQLNEDGERWQEELVPVVDRTAEQVIETHITAIGGREALAPLRHLRLEYDVAVTGGSRTTTEWFAPDQYRVLTQQGTALVEEVIYNGKQALMTTPDMSGEITDAGLEAIRAQALPVPEVGYDKIMERRLLLGSTTIAGKKVYKVSMVSQSGTSFAVYFDAASGLKLRRTEDRLIDGRLYAVSTNYTDWKVINGVLFPHTVTEFGGSTGTVVRTITKVETNKSMPPGFFDVVIPEVPETPLPPELMPPTEEE